MPAGGWERSPEGEEVEVRFVHPFQAVKEYRCPGCNQQIPPRTGHVVVVPVRDVHARRHWHRSCWDHRHRRRPGR